MEIGTPAWHADRRLGIGGSDAAAALGLSKWKTPYQLYLEKIGEAEPQPENWAMGRGKALEPLLRQHYADTTGREVRLPAAALVSEQYAYMRYNPDGLADGRLIEFKTAAYGDGWGEEGSDEIPQEYLLQVQHGMVVTGLPVTDVTVSIAGNEPRYFLVEADKELAEMIIEREAAFWRRVENHEPPEPTTNEDVARMYRKVTGERIEATPDIQMMIVSLLAHRDLMKQMELQKEVMEVAIKAFMGFNDTIVDQYSVPLVTWKAAAGASRIDSKRLKTEQPEIAAQYTTVGESSRRFLIK